MPAGEHGRVAAAPQIETAVSNERALTFLIKASTALSSTLDHFEVTRRIAELVIPYLADWCAVDLVQEGRIVRQEVAASTAEKQAALHETFRRHPPEWSSAHPASRAMRLGRPILLSDLGRPSEEGAYTEYLRHIEHLGARSMLAVPVRARGTILGAVTLFFADSGRHYGADDVALAEELARHVAIAEENARLFDEARRASRLRDEVLAVVAHDLRNPLSTIMTAANLIGRRSEAPERMAKPQELISRSVHRMERLIDDLLDVAAIESGTLRMQIAPLDPAAVVRGVCESFAARLAEREQVLTCDCEELPHLRGDADRLHQVLANLLGNAAKFSPDRAAVRVTAAAGKGTIHISVADEGPGIAADEVPHLFERFWQSTRTRAGGAGLGLPIAKGIVDAHGGTLSVRTSPGHGTVFTVTLPIRR